MMASTALPAPEVAVATMAISARRVSACADSTTLASGVSRRVDSFSASSLAVSGATSVTSSAVTPVGDWMPVTRELMKGGAQASTFSNEFMNCGGDTRDSNSIGLTFLKYCCDSGWITKAERLVRLKPLG